MVSYEVVSYDAGTEIDLFALNKKFSGQTKKFKWTEPFIKKLSSESYAFIYDFGAIVFVNVEVLDRDSVFSEVKEFVKNPFENPLREDFLIEVDPLVKKEEVTFDNIIIPKLDLDLLKILTFALAQSVTLHSAEDLTDSTLDMLEDILKEFKVAGKLANNKKLVQSVASAAQIRHSVISNISVLDRPPVTWESKKLGNLYDDMEKMFELRDRFSSLEHKLSIIMDNCTLVLDITNTRKSLILEWAIVIFFLIDIILIFIELFV